LDHNEDAYFNENWQMLEVRKTVSGTINSNPLQQYVWHPFYIDAPVLRDYDATCSGSPTRYYDTFDARFSVTAATGSTGSPAERYSYSPFGTITFLTGGFAVLSTQQSQIGNDTAFTGRQVDAESGFLYFRNRLYHSELGAFVRRDPRGYSDILNLYDAGFVPKTMDPFGLLPFGCWASLEANVAVFCCGLCNWTNARNNAWNARNTGQQIANQLYPNRGVLNNVWNRAIRHCIASAILTQTNGENCAACLGDQREVYQTQCEDQPPGDMRTGIANNGQGRNCGSGRTPGYGQSVQEAVRCCQNKLDGGLLRLGDPGPGPD
jgi:RHS repeat-associated protein